jgi:hypothetical protein
MNRHPKDWLIPGWSRRIRPMSTHVRIPRFYNDTLWPRFTTQRMEILGQKRQTGCQNNQSAYGLGLDVMKMMIL